MQNIISFYYLMNVTHFEIKNDSFYFDYKNNQYLFARFLYALDDVNNIIEISHFLESRGIKCHTIIENVNKEVITEFNNNKYILFKLTDSEKLVDVFTITEFNYKTIFKLSKYNNNWGNLWIKKVDRIEETLKNGIFDQIVTKTVDYYLGLAENAIECLTNINAKYYLNDVNLCISHKRISDNNIIFLNPLNMIADVVVRDVSEYLKYLFFNNSDPMVDLRYFLNSNIFSSYEINLLYTRLLFPTYYFDILENYFNKKQNSDDLLSIAKKKDDYEKFLKKAYYELSKYASLENIEWLKL